MLRRISDDVYSVGIAEHMPTKPLKIDSLELDVENPRIALATDQRDAVQKIIAEQKVKLVNLAERIAVREFGLMDRCLVVLISARVPTLMRSSGLGFILQAFLALVFLWRALWPSIHNREHSFTR